MKSDSVAKQSKGGQSGGGQFEIPPGPYVLASDGLAGESHGEERADSFDLGSIVAIFRRRIRLALAIFSATVALGTALTIYQRQTSPLYQGGFTLMLSDPITTGAGSQDSTSPLRDVALQSVYDKATNDLIVLLTSSALLDPVASRMGVSQTAMAKALAIQGQSGESSGILNVYLKWNDKEEGKRILEEISKEYLSFSLRERQNKLFRGLSFLDQQAPTLKQNVADIQQQLSTFRSKYSFLDPSTQGESTQIQRQELEVRQNELLRKEAELRAAAATLKSGNLESPLIQGTAQSELTSLEKELAKAESIYQPTASVLVILRDRISRLRTQEQQRQLKAIQASQSQVSAEIVEIQKQQMQLNRQFSMNPAQIKQYEDLRQRLEVAQENLAAYRKSREAFRLEVAQRTTPWRAISQPSFDSKLVSPDIRKNLLLSVLVGAVAGGGAALLRDKLDNVFHSPEEVKQALALSLLGTVPHLPMAVGSTVPERVAAMEVSPRFALRESLRNLITNLYLLRTDKSLRLIALTSSDQGEGKSLVLTLLAQALGELGQRVLMVDADLRSPTLHKQLGEVNWRGFSNLLTDVDSTTEQHFIQPVNEALDLLTAGPVPPDAPRLFASRRCAEVIEQLRAMPGYDYVLFDLPPAHDLSDPLLISEYLDGILFLVSLKHAKRERVINAVNRITASGSNVLGLITNWIHPGKESEAVDQYQGYNSYIGASIDSSDGQVNDERRSGQHRSNDRLGNRVTHRVRRFVHWF